MGIKKNANVTERSIKLTIGPWFLFTNTFTQGIFVILWFQFKNGLGTRGLTFWESRRTGALDWLNIMTSGTRTHLKHFMEDLKILVILNLLSFLLEVGMIICNYSRVRYRFMAMDRLGRDLQKVCDGNGGGFKPNTVLLLGHRLVRAVFELKKYTGGFMWDWWTSQLSLLMQVDVLQYIHENEYVHADIKAANLMQGHRDPHQVRATKIHTFLCMWEKRFDHLLSYHKSYHLWKKNPKQYLKTSSWIFFFVFFYQGFYNIYIYIYSAHTGSWANHILASEKGSLPLVNLDVIEEVMSTDKTEKVVIIGVFFQFFLKLC